MHSALLDLARTILPSAQRRRLHQTLRRLQRPAVLGTIRRTTPLSDSWGIDRGTPVDRRFIEQFLAEHRADIHGHVLEVKNRRYADRFGCGVDRCSVLDIDPSNAAATICADLAAARAIPSEHFDCFILTQTLQFIFDTRAALGHAHRILRSGGVLLATVPSMGRVDRELPEIDCWRFTAPACKALFQELFAADRLTIRAYGNVLAGTAFWNGMAAEELSAD